jgi:hypothetical protein
VEHPDKDYSTQKLILGTHTSDNEQNYLMIAEVQARSGRALRARGEHALARTRCSALTRSRAHAHAGARSCRWKTRRWTHASMTTSDKRRAASAPAPAKCRHAAHARTRALTTERRRRGSAANTRRCKQPAGIPLWLCCLGSVGRVCVARWRRRRNAVHAWRTRRT